MRELYVDGVSIEITNINADALIKSGALVEAGEELRLNEDHQFTYDEVRVLIFPGEVTDYVA